MIGWSTWLPTHQAALTHPLPVHSLRVTWVVFNKARLDLLLKLTSQSRVLWEWLCTEAWRKGGRGIFFFPGWIPLKSSLPWLSSWKLSTPALRCNARINAGRSVQGREVSLPPISLLIAWLYSGATIDFLNWLARERDRTNLQSENWNCEFATSWWSHKSNMCLALIFGIWAVWLMLQGCI